MATAFIRVPGTGGAPEDYLVSGATDIDLLSCAAHFNGAGAGSDFFPAIQILDEAGQVSATVVGPKVTAGDSADVTFAPFLEAPTTGGTTDPLAVHYDTAQGAGHFLTSTTTLGTTIEDSGPALGSVFIQADNGSGGGGFVSLTTADGETFIGSTTIVNKLNPVGGNFEVQDHSAFKMIQAQEGGFVFVNLKAGVMFTVSDSLGAPIFEVREDGSIHGRAAVGAINWDL